MAGETASEEAAELSARQKDFLYGYPDGYIACRGDHHDWPLIKPGRLPRGVHAYPVPGTEGVYQIVVRCRNCGRERIKTTLPAGVYDASAVWAYREPGDYRAPAGLGLRRADYTRELFRRVFEDRVAQSSPLPGVTDA